MKRILALLVCLMLLAGSALAAEPFAPHWAQLEKEMAQGQGIHLDLSAKLHEWSPFETETTLAINALLSHFTFGVDYYQQPEETQYALSVLSENEPLITVSQLDNEEGTEWFSDLYDAVYTLEKNSGAEPLSLMAKPQEGEALVWEEMLLGEMQLDAFFSHLSQVLMSEGKASNSSKNLSKIGRAAKTYKITTDGPGAQTIVQKAMESLDSPSISAMAEKLTFSGKKNIFTLYEKKDGTLLGVNFTGNAAYGDGDARKVSITWGIKDEGAKRLDTLSLTAPSVKGKNDLTVKLTWQRAWKDGENTQSLEGTINNKLDKVTTKEKIDIDLKNAKGAKGHKVTGTISLETTQDDVKSSLVVKPSLESIAGADGVSMTGTFDIQTKQRGKTMLSTVLTVELTPGSESIFEAAALMEMIPLEELSPEALAETEADLAQMLAHRLLMAVMDLPEEDLKVLKYGISDSNWQSIMEVFQEIAP